LEPGLEDDRVVVADCWQAVDDRSFIYRQSVGDQEASSDWNLSQTRCPLRKTASNLFLTTLVSKMFTVQHRQPPCDRFTLVTS